MVDTNLFFEPADLSNDMQAYLENSKAQHESLSKYGGVVLKEVKIRGQAYKSTNLGGAGYADQVINRGNFTRSGGVFSQQFNGRLMGVRFAGDEGNKNAYVIMTRSPKKAQPMLLVLDGVQIVADSTFSLDALVNVDEIETVEVLRSVANESAYGINGAGGVLVVTTRRGDDQETNLPATGLLTISPPGFYKAREFYSPKYDHAITGFLRKDLRSTIYWNPEVITDKEGNASFDYYNADDAGSYRVVVEGIDDKGNLGRQVYRYKVE
jgi:hypothetical protein